MKLQQEPSLFIAVVSVADRGFHGRSSEAHKLCGDRGHSLSCLAAPFHFQCFLRYQSSSAV
ncbi:unnamed protein product, partial [Bubo scandiacus]